MTTNQVNPNPLSNQVNAIHGHARKCRKPLDDCPSCQSGMRFIKELSPSVANLVLTDPPATPVSRSLSSGVLETMMNRTLDKSCRARRDTTSAMVVLGRFEQQGGKLHRSL